MHHLLFVGMFVFVNFWTISIHDQVCCLLIEWIASANLSSQVDFCGAGIINSTGHHTIHHRDFVFNYGQYFTLWDRLCGSYRAAEQTNSILTGERIPHKASATGKKSGAAAASTTTTTDTRNKRAKANDNSNKSL